MTNIVEQLGIQSYCFRGSKELDVLIERLKATGVAKIELCGVHTNFSDDSQFESVISQFEDGGVEIVAIGVQGFNNDPANERKYFEFVKRAGAKFMSVNFQPNTVPDSFRTAEALADEYDVKLAIHNHGGHHWLGNTQMLQQVFDTTSDRIGLCLDTAWALDAREDPVKMAERFADRLYGLHVKDFVFDRAGKPEDVVVGTGNLDMVALYNVLKDSDFNGYTVIEYEGDVDNPVPALTDCVTAIRRDMAG